MYVLAYQKGLEDFSKPQFALATSFAILMMKLDPNFYRWLINYKEPSRDKLITTQPSTS
jgi:hypothetical protein